MPIDYILLFPTNALLIDVNPVEFDIKLSPILLTEDPVKAPDNVVIPVFPTQKLFGILVILLYANTPVRLFTLVLYFIKSIGSYDIYVDLKIFYILIRS